MFVMPKIHIVFPFADGPSGGGNQFLKALREIWREQGIYAEKPEHSTAILFNSHHLLGEVWRLRKRFPGQAFIHRVDGPLSLVRGRDIGEDAAIHAANAALAHGTIFQSRWSREHNRSMGLKAGRNEIVLVNAPSPVHFHQRGRIPWSTDRRIRLIATSWSDNERKGFQDLLHLDQNLDFSRYDMTFIGNSPIRFERIRVVSPLPSAELAAELRQHDIYVAASRRDPCSNALLEALHCGLPALALADGGHPELIGEGGVLYQQPAEMIAAIDQIAAQYIQYQNTIRLPTLAQTAVSYAAFVCAIQSNYQKMRWGSDWALGCAMLRWKIGQEYAQIQKVLLR